MLPTLPGMLVYCNREESATASLQPITMRSAPGNPSRRMSPVGRKRTSAELDTFSMTILCVIDSPVAAVFLSSPQIIGTVPIVKILDSL